MSNCYVFLFNTENLLMYTREWWARRCDCYQAEWQRYTTCWWHQWLDLARSAAETKTGQQLQHPAWNWRQRWRHVDWWHWALQDCCMSLTHRCLQPCTPASQQSTSTVNCLISQLLTDWLIPSHFITGYCNLLLLSLAACCTLVWWCGSKAGLKVDVCWLYLSEVGAIEWEVDVRMLNDIQPSTWHCYLSTSATHTHTHIHLRHVTLHVKPGCLYLSNRDWPIAALAVNILSQLRTATVAITDSRWLSPLLKL